MRKFVSDWYKHSLVQCAYSCVAPQARSNSTKQQKRKKVNRACRKGKTYIKCLLRFVAKPDQRHLHLQIVFWFGGQQFGKPFKVGGITVGDGQHDFHWFIVQFVEFLTKHGLDQQPSCDRHHTTWQKQDKKSAHKCMSLTCLVQFQCAHPTER